MIKLDLSYQNINNESTLMINIKFIYSALL